MSNLIKSGRVVELEVPVNVGIKYNFNSSKIISDKIVKKENPSQIIENNSQDYNKVNKEKVLNQEEILNKYIEEAKKKAEEVYQSELEKAYNEGISKAQEEAEAIIQEATNIKLQVVEEIANIKEELNNEYKEEIKSAEKDLIEISLDIVEKIINYEVDKSDDYVVGVVKDSLDRVMSKKDVVLKLSTSDYYTVLANKKYLMANVKGFGEIEIVQDESMEPGTCIVDTPLGVIDGSIQVRMDNIHKEVMKMLEEQ